MPDSNKSDSTLRLHRCGARDPGHILGLRKGDVLAGLNGAPWAGSFESFRARFSASDQALALTFRRGDRVLTVMTDRPDLGIWESTPADTAPVALPSGRDRLCNWEILAHPVVGHELFALRPSLLALIAPPVWLAQMRLWTWLATLAAAMAVALPGGLLLVGGVWIATGLHLWRAGDRHLRAARLAEGFRKVGVIAAAREDEARAGWKALVPDARFRFDPPSVGGPDQVESRPVAI